MNSRRIAPSWQVRACLNFVFSFLLLILGAVPAHSQAVIATVGAGVNPGGVAVNPKTNKIYVTNFSSNDVTVIDGATNSTTTVADPNAKGPGAVAVNPVTNKIYVANFFSSNVTVIDGASNDTITITDPNAVAPLGVAVNTVTNKIYVVNNYSSNVTVIDGATNAATTVTDPRAQGSTHAVAVNTVTNKIYVVNYDGVGSRGSITVIDGATNSTTNVTGPKLVAPIAEAVNQVTDKIYMAPYGDFNSSVTVIDGNTDTISTIKNPSGFVFSSNGPGPAVAVDTVTNIIYVTDNGRSTRTDFGGVLVIDGTTNAATVVTDPNAVGPIAEAVNSVTNKVYVTNYSNNVTVIDGATKATATVTDPNAVSPDGIAVNTVTNRIYVTNSQSNDVTVIDGSVQLPVLTLSPPSLTFRPYHPELVGTRSAFQAVTLTNTSSEEATISSISSSVEFPQINDCGSSLAAGASCTIKVAFQPNNKGTRSGTLHVASNGYGSPLHLRGNGTFVDLSATSLSFADQKVGTTSSPQSVTLTNTGKVAATMSIEVAGMNPGDFAQTNDCGTSLAPAASCTMSVTFTPTITGTRNAHVAMIGINGPGNKEDRVHLSGTGIQ